jgi:nucleotide-binding universal stress UspA family protein
MTIVDDRSKRVGPRNAGSEDSPSRRGRIVVGIDGSERSLHALAWAVREAGLRGCTVHVVMAWQHPQAYNAANVWGLGIDPWIDTDANLSTSAKLEAVRLVERLTQQARPAKNLPTRCEAIEGHPASVLLSAAKNADLLVVGSRGHGGFVGMLIGSVSHHVLAHSPCPVVVVPDPQDRHDAA